MIARRARPAAVLAVLSLAALSVAACSQNDPLAARTSSDGQVFGSGSGVDDGAENGTASDVPAASGSDDAPTPEVAGSGSSGEGSSGTQGDGSPSAASDGQPSADADPGGDPSDSGADDGAGPDDGSAAADPPPADPAEGDGGTTMSDAEIEALERELDEIDQLLADMESSFALD